MAPKDCVDGVAPVNDAGFGMLQAAAAEADAAGPSENAHTSDALISVFFKISVERMRSKQRNFGKQSAGEKVLGGLERCALQNKQKN
jgi:hypothetical protein